MRLASETASCQAVSGFFPEDSTRSSWAANGAGDGAGVRVLEERTYRLGSLAEDLRRMLTAKEVHWTRDFRIVVGFRGDGEVAIVDVLAYLGLYAEQLADRGKGCLGIRGAGRDRQE